MLSSLIESINVNKSVQKYFFFENGLRSVLYSVGYCAVDLVLICGVGVGVGVATLFSI